MAVRKNPHHRSTPGPATLNGGSIYAVVMSLAGGVDYQIVSTPKSPNLGSFGMPEAHRQQLEPLVPAI